MNPFARLLVAAGCLGAGVAVQGALQSHLDHDGPGDYPELRFPLASLPRTLRTEVPVEGDGAVKVVWHGSDVEGLAEFRETLPFEADDLLLRVYRAERGGPLVRVYAVHSRLGEDRQHHPEVCIRDVQGAPEEVRARAILPLHGDRTRPAQRFRFRTGTARGVTVYYWHYTFEPRPRPGQSFLQLVHQKVGTPAPSLTVQVSSEAPPGALGVVEAGFLVGLDRALAGKVVPETARVGCRRLPVGLAWR